MKNELPALEALLAELPCGGTVEQIQRCCRSMTGIWEQVLFSDASVQALERYFSFHLKGISALSDALFDKPGFPPVVTARAELKALIFLLLEVYSKYIDRGITVPGEYLKAYVERNGKNVSSLIKKMHCSSLDRKLAGYLEDYLNTFLLGNTNISLLSLEYLQYFTAELSAVEFGSECAERQVCQILLETDFNHLGVLVWFQKNIIQPEDLREVFAVPVQELRRFDPNWPSLKSMLAAWRSETACENKAIGVPLVQKQKLPLAISVAQLAFFIKLFVQAGHLPDVNLSNVFRFVAENFSAKRQRVISAGSLSKEYYGANQQTAARVMGMLEDMILAIKRQFFP